MITPKNQLTRTVETKLKRSMSIKQKRPRADSIASTNRPLFSDRDIFKVCFQKKIIDNQGGFISNRMLSPTKKKSQAPNTMIEFNKGAATSLKFSTFTSCGLTKTGAMLKLLDNSNDNISESEHKSTNQFISS